MSSNRWSLSFICVVLLLAVGSLPAAAQPDLLPLRGSAGKAATLAQEIDLTGLTFTAGEELRLTAFGDGANANSRLRIRVIVRYADQPNHQVALLFTGNHTGLTRASQVITLSSANVTRITVRIRHLSPGGRFLLDRVYLTRQ